MASFHVACYYETDCFKDRAAAGIGFTWEMQVVIIYFEEYIMLRRVLHGYLP